MTDWQTLGTRPRPAGATRLPPPACGGEGSGVGGGATWTDAAEDAPPSVKRSFRKVATGPGAPHP